MDRHTAHIADHGYRARMITEISPVLLRRRGFSMAQVIVSEDINPVVRKEFRKLPIASDMFHHSMGDLDDGLHLAVRNPLHTVEIRQAAAGWYIKFVDLHNFRLLHIKHFRSQPVDT